MKLFPKLGNGYAEVDTPNDVTTYVWMKILTALMTCVLWCLGFACFAFGIYFLMTNAETILYLIGEAFENLGNMRR